MLIRRWPVSNGIKATRMVDHNAPTGATKGDGIMWYLVILERVVLGVYGAALREHALQHQAELADGTHQIASVVSSPVRYYVGERIPANARIVFEP